MVKVIIRDRLPWEDRWSQPTYDELWEPQKEHHKRLLPAFLEGLQKFEDLEHTLAWHGTAWCWTIEVNMPSADLGGKAADQESFAYIVPRPETPLICIPLTDETIESMPMRRLNRFVRDGIKGAKQSVEQHWGKWTPTAQAEVDHLLDLVKRKIKHIKAS